MFLLLLLKTNILKVNINKKSFEVIYKNEKPYIKNEEIYISISHDRDYVVVAFSDRLVGCDIQFYNDKVKINKLIGLDNNVNYNDSIDLFSKKEAIIKLHGSKLKNINDYDIGDYSFISYKTKYYVINVACQK